MDTKGITPLMATVLLIGFTVVLAAIVLVWGWKFLFTTQEDIDLANELNFACTRVKFELENFECWPEGFHTSLSLLTVKNQGNQEIAGFIFRAFSEGGPVPNLYEYFKIEDDLKGFGSFRDNFLKEAIPVGLPKRLEVIPQVEVDGVIFDCNYGAQEYDLDDGNHVACTCGDGIIDPGEQCDSPTDCTQECTLL